MGGTVAFSATELQVSELRLDGALSVYGVTNRPAEN